MSIGLQVINDSGVVQIDEFYRNFVFRQKFTINTPDRAGQWISLNNCYAPIPVQYSNDPDGINILESKKTGNDWQWRVQGIGEVFIFDTPPVLPGPGYGLQVYNADGSLAFDSQFDVLRPMGAIRTRPHFDGKDYPIQTLSSTSADYFNSGVSSPSYNTVEPMSVNNPGQYPAYAKPAAYSGQKWGWIYNGSSRSYYNDNGTWRKYVAAFFESGDNFKVHMRHIGEIGSGEYGPANSTSGTGVLIFVNLTGL